MRFAEEKLPRQRAARRAEFRRLDREALEKEAINLVSAEDHYDLMDNLSDMSVRELEDFVVKNSGKMPIAHLNNLLKDLNTFAAEDGWKGLPLGDLKGILRKYTPEFTDAREARSAVMEGTVTPYRQGLAGDIARMGGGVSPDKYTANGNILRMVFPPDKAQPAAITKLAADIGAEPVGWILRDHLERALQTAGSAIRENPQAPADFVKAVAGNSAQRSNLEAALFTIAKDNKVNPFAVRNGFYQLMSALKTFKDTKVDMGIDRASAAFQAGTSVPGAMAAPNSRIGRFFWERASTKTYQDIANLVTSRDGLAKLEAIARTPEPQARQALIASILTGAEVGNRRTLGQPNTRE